MQLRKSGTMKFSQVHIMTLNAVWKIILNKDFSKILETNMRPLHESLFKFL